jgi:DNA-binding NarL/FixJ family response regulator
MKVGVLCRDPLLRDGLQCLLSSLPLSTKLSMTGSMGALERALSQGEVDIVIAAIEETEIGDLASLEAAKKRREIYVIAIVEGDSLPAPMDSIVDRIINRNQGFEGLRKAFLEVESASKAPAIREPSPVYGLPRGLTPREREVANLVSQGLANRSIALTLGIQEQSVKNLVSGVMRKLDCENRTQLALQLSTTTH